MPYIDSHSPYTLSIPIHFLIFFSFHISAISLIVLEMEKPRATEIKVRMDCNGCVQKIKKALHGIPGIHDIYVDFSEQKIAVTGWAEPEKLVKAIRKTRKSAVICVHTEQSDEAGTPTEPPPPEGETATEGGAPPPEMPPEPTDQRAEPTEVAPPGEGSDKPPEPTYPPPAASQHHQPPRQQDHEGVHIVYHHPPDHGYQYPYGPNLQQGHGGQWNTYHGGPGFRGEPHQPPQPAYVQSYNTYRPSPHVTEYAYPQSPPRHSFNSRPDHYSGPGLRGAPPQPVHSIHSYNTYKSSPYVTRYAYPQSPPKHSSYSRLDNYSDPGFRGEPSQPPQPIYATHNYMYKPSPYVTECAYPESPPRYSPYSIPSNYSLDYHSGSYENGNVTSMLSEENPNACRIM